MISAKKLIKLARKWQKLAAIRRKRIRLPETAVSLNANNGSTSLSPASEKGHFVVYTVDQRRFVLPLSYLNKAIVIELFNLAEEEFGLPSNGPLTLPCDAAFMECVITLIQQNVTKKLEKELLVSIASRRCSSTVFSHQQYSISSF